LFPDRVSSTKCGAAENWKKNKKKKFNIHRWKSGNLIITLKNKN
jgi:hypothetical protein